MSEGVVVGLEPVEIEEQEQEQLLPRRRGDVALKVIEQLSKSTAARVRSELRERFEAFKRRDLYETRLAALFCDPIYLAARPPAPKEGVALRLGFTDTASARSSRSA